MRARLAFVLISKLYRQMYANTGIATDSARVSAVGALGAMDRPGVPAAVPRGADARISRCLSRRSARTRLQSARKIAASHAWS